MEQGFYICAKLTDGMATDLDVLYKTSIRKVIYVCRCKISHFDGCTISLICKQFDKNREKTQKITTKRSYEFLKYRIK